MIARVRALRKFLESVVDSRRDSTGSHVATLDRIAAQHPDGFFRHLAAGAHLQAAKRTYELHGIDPPQDSDVRREMSTAYRMFAEATKMSSLYQNSRVEALHFQLIVGTMIWNWPQELRPSELEDELYDAAIDLLQRKGLTQMEWEQLFTLGLGVVPAPTRVMDVLVHARARHFPNDPRTIEGEILYHLKFERIEAARAALEDGKRRFPTRSGWEKLEARFPTVVPEIRPAASQPAGR